MATGHRRKTYDDLTPEQKASFDRHRAARNTPESREAEIRDREVILEEYRRTGTVETDGDPVWPDDLVRFKRFVAGLKARREASGLTVAEVAERAEIDPVELNRLEAGRGNPTAFTLARYCHALGGRVAWGFEAVEGGDR